MKNETCPLCSSKINLQLYHIYKDSNDILVVLCSNCLHTYTYFEKDINTECLYKDEVYEVVDNRGSIFDKIIEMECLHIISKLKNKYIKNKSILDFGCGKGKFLSVAKKEGFNVMGIETEINRANFARDIYKINVKNDYYLSGKIRTEPFQIITLFHVLEHLQNPVEILTNLVKDNLDYDGLVIIEVPNISSLQAKIAKELWMHIDVPRHISHFTFKSLAKIAEKSGLIILETEYFSSHLGIIGLVQSLMSKMGYTNNIIQELKHNNRNLFLGLLLLTPFAILIELIASRFGYGGIIRIYCKKNNSLEK
ncbi:MAG: class I SAM-dependent methyltransferase [Ignavibacteria bacterium]